MIPVPDPLPACGPVRIRYDAKIKFVGGSGIPAQIKRARGTGAPRPLDHRVQVSACDTDHKRGTIPREMPEGSRHHRRTGSGRNGCNFCSLPPSRSQITVCLAPRRNQLGTKRHALPGDGAFVKCVATPFPRDLTRRRAAEPTGNRPAIAVARHHFVPKLPR